MNNANVIIYDNEMRERIYENFVYNNCGYVGISESDHRSYEAAWSFAKET